MHDHRFRVRPTILTISTFVVILAFVGLVLVSFPLAKSFLVGVAIWLATILIRRVWAQLSRYQRTFTRMALGLLSILICALAGIGGFILFTYRLGPLPTPIVIPSVTGTPTPEPTPTPTPVPTQVKTDSFAVDYDVDLELKDNTLISHEVYLITSKDVAVKQITIAKPAGKLDPRDYSIEERNTEFVLTRSISTEFGPCTISPGGQTAIVIDRELTTDPLGFLTRRATLPLLTNKIDLAFAGPTDRPEGEQLSYFEVNTKVKFVLPPYSFLRGSPPPDSRSVTADGERLMWEKLEKAQLGRREETIAVDYADVPIGSEVIRTVIGRLTFGGVIDLVLTTLGGLLATFVGKDTVLRWSKTLVDRVRARLEKREASTDRPS